MPACETGLELACLGISIGIPAVSGLGGVVLGAWLTWRREISQRQFAFIEKQLHDFYSPLLGIRSEILMRSELRKKISDTANEVWKKLCAEREGNPSALDGLSGKRFPEFKKIIEYDNRQLREELIPGYRKMVDLFRDNMWLAEPETREHFKLLLEFVGIWERYLDNSLPGEVIKALNHGENSLHPFYDHLQKKHDELRKKLGNGDV